MLRLIYNNHDTINIPNKYVKIFQYKEPVTIISPDLPNSIQYIKNVRITIDKDIDQSNVRVLDYSGNPCPFDHNNKKLSIILNERRDLAKIYQYRTNKSLFVDWDKDSSINENDYQVNELNENNITLTIQ